VHTYTAEVDKFLPKVRTRFEVDKMATKLTITNNLSAVYTYKYFTEF